MDSLRPRNFLDSPGEPCVEFEEWLSAFTSYVFAIGGEQFSDQRLRAVLVSCLGTEGQRQLNALGNTPLRNALDPQVQNPLFQEAIQRLRERFMKKRSKVSRRSEFLSRFQREDETMGDFVCSLRYIASKCDFNAYSEDQAIVDQIISHTTNPDIRERLLLEGDVLTLGRAMDIATRLETASNESRKLAAASQTF